MDIAEVVRRSGVPASTLRYYEEKGLIRSVGRRGLRRQRHAERAGVSGVIREKLGEFWRSARLQPCQFWRDRSGQCCGKREVR